MPATGAAGAAGQLQVLDLFSGIGGFSLGLERVGMRTVAFCEVDPYCRAVLRKHWPAVRCFEDVRSLSASDLTERIDVICGGFPCQDISWAGDGAGIDGERSGLWREFARLIREIRPRFVIVENVAALLVRGMARVLGDLAEARFDAEWSCVSGCSLGAPHMRQRMFIVAYPNGEYGRPRVWNPDARQDGPIQAIDRLEGARVGYRARLANPSELYRGADGLPNGMDRNHALGNSVMPDQAEFIGRAILSIYQPNNPPTTLPNHTTGSSSTTAPMMSAQGSRERGSRMGEAF